MRRHAVAARPGEPPFKALAAKAVVPVVKLHEGGRQTGLNERVSPLALI